MKRYLVSGMILAFLLGSASAMAEPDRRGYLSGGQHHAERGKGGPEHKKFLTSRYRGDHGHRGGYRDQKHHKGHGWQGHPGRHHGYKHGWKRGYKHGYKDGWQHGKRHHWKYGYHDDRREWRKHRPYRHRDSGYRYRLHYNGVVGSPASGHISIDLSRR